MRDAATGLKVKRNGKAHPKAGRPARSRLKVRTGMKAGAQSRLWL